MPECTKTQEAISEAVDQAILGIIRDGRPVLDESGAPLKDKDGKIIRRPPTAADINAAINRLKHVGVSAIPSDTNAVGEIMRRMRLVGSEVPDVDTEGDDAATA